MDRQQLRLSVRVLGKLTSIFWDKGFRNLQSAMSESDESNFCHPVHLREHWCTRFLGCQQSQIVSKSQHRRLQKRDLVIQRNLAEEK